MVNGNKKDYVKRIVVFDLDGTLCTKNTYKIFFLSSSVFYLLSFQMVSFFKVFLVIRKRWRRDFSRWDMKRELAKIFNNSKFRGLNRYIIQLQIRLFLRTKLLNDYTRDGDLVVLATAALESYLSGIEKNLGIPYMICTTNQDLENDKECLALEKKIRVQNFLNGESIDFFFTDHYDDIPTIEIANKTFLVNPKDKTYEIVMSTDHHKKVEILRF